MFTLGRAGRFENVRNIVRVLNLEEPFKKKQRQLAIDEHRSKLNRFHALIRRAKVNFIIVEGRGRGTSSMHESLILLRIPPRHSGEIQSYGVILKVLSQLSWQC